MIKTCKPLQDQTEWKSPSAGWTPSMASSIFETERSGNLSQRVSRFGLGAEGNRHIPIKNGKRDALGIVSCQVLMNAKFFK